ncbi:MAG: hypothetical protein V8R50_03040 [Clostridia bacterium]
MLTKQDITVLSELLDQGLKPVREDLNRLHKDFEGLNNKFNGLRQDMNEKIEGLRTEMYQLIGDLREEMRTEISRLDNRCCGLREEMHSEISGLREEMRTEIRRLDDKIDNNISSLREEMHRGFDEIHTILNTDISPRLKTIEDCYLKTFERYSESVERQKKMEEDISVMKDVIQEHSVQLQKLCS